MLIQMLQTIDPNDAQIQIAAITGISSILVAAIVGIFSYVRSHPKTPDEDPDANVGKAESLLSTYSGEQNDFMHLVIQDSKAVHERLDKFETIVEQMKKERTQLIGAFTRYISKLVSSWGSGGRMPYPDGEDLKILEETLPADWRNKSK